jgi:hypothetical protein
MFRHPPGSWRAVNLKRFFPSHNPGREDEVGETKSVIGMEMREKGDPEVHRFQPPDAILASSRSLPDHSGAKINEIRRTVDDNGCSRAGVLRSGAGVPVRRRTICVLWVGALCAGKMPCQMKRNKTINPKALGFFRFVVIQPSSPSGRIEGIAPTTLLAFLYESDWLRLFDIRRFAFLAQRHERTEARTRLFTFLTSAGL